MVSKELPILQSLLCTLMSDVYVLYAFLLLFVMFGRVPLLVVHCLHRESCCVHLIAVDAILIDMVQVHIANMRGPGTRPHLREERANRLECFAQTRAEFPAFDCM